MTNSLIKAVQKGVQDNKVMLTAHGGFPINCYYMVIATLHEGVDVVSSED